MESSSSLSSKKESVPKKVFVVPAQEVGKPRLDVFLAERLGTLSRSQVQSLIEDQKVLVDGRPSKPSHRLGAGESVTLEFVVERPKPLQPEDIPLKICHADKHIIILEKPSGMVVHPGTGVPEHTLVNALLFHYPEVINIGAEQRPGLVHRLDKETSGVMVVARSRQAYWELQRQFKAREVEKLYLGLVWGRMPERAGTIDWAIGRHVRHRERMSTKTHKPRSAETLYKVEKEFQDFSLLKIRPVTGRTHQIRVHLMAAGHPVVGDTRYGKRKAKIRCPRLFLHATQLRFVHPKTQEKVSFHSPLPPDLQNYLDQIST